MSIAFEHIPHPHIAARKKSGPPKTTDESVGLNGKIALILTTTVGTMWCTYAFALLALVALPSALNGGLLAMIQWVSQTFIQLVLLSIIMVGQNISAAASDARALATYNDADAILHTALAIEQRLIKLEEVLSLALKNRSGEHDENCSPGCFSDHESPGAP